ncbi:MAG: magnesium transporter [Janthinobacterium lividum]
MTSETFETAKESSEELLFGASSELIEDISEALALDDLVKVTQLTEELHASDMADLIVRLSSQDREKFVEAFKSSITAETLSEIDDSIRREVLEILGTKGIAAAISELESDDALDLISDLDEEQQEEVLRTISANERAILEEVLTYPEDSAGRLMQHEIICVPPFWTIEETISFVRDTHGLPDSFYTIYVVDARQCPMGEIYLSTLFRHPLKSQVSEIMQKTQTTITVAQDETEVADLFRHYHLVSAPVVDPSGRIVGMITLDDIFEVVEEEADKNLLNFAKVHESDFRAPIATTAYWRIRWLVITLINTLIASFVISRFQGSIQQISALSFLMTINAAMGGNAGMQVVTIAIRSLATHSLREGETWKAVRKEVSIAMITGGFFSLLLGGIAALWVHDLRLGIILSVAVLFNILWAAFAGTILPIVIDRMDLDPAISAGPILTTTTDVLGYTVFLGLATMFLL